MRFISCILFQVYQLSSPFHQQNPTYVPARHFLSLRAVGAPAVVLSLSLQGIFRGFKDTKTPVICLGKSACTLIPFEGSYNTQQFMNTLFLLLPTSHATLRNEQI